MFISHIANVEFHNSFVCSP